MKKTLIIGLALAFGFGLTGCFKPSATVDDMIYIKAKFGGEIVGECVYNEHNIDPMLVDFDAIPITEVGKKYLVRIETTYPIWSMEHLSHALKVTLPGGTAGTLYGGDGLDAAASVDCPDPALWLFFEYKPKKAPNAGDRILHNGYVKLTYRCIFAHWGYIDADGNLAKGGVDEFGNVIGSEDLYLPAVKMGLYSYDIVVERLVGDIGEYTIEYGMHVEGRVSVTPEKAALGSCPEYTGFKISLPNMPYNPEVL